MPLPQLAPTGTPIRISHKEAILASSLLRMLAWDMTRHAVVELGEEGLLYVLVSRILKERPPGLVGGKSFFGKLHAHLKLVHRVEGLESKRTRVILERFEMWDEWRAWHLAST
jgi:hypothetical protein